VNELLDQKNENHKSEQTIKTLHKTFILLWLFYGCYIFINYLTIRNSIESSLLPEYTNTYIYGEQAFRGILIMLTLITSEITSIFNRKIAVAILIAPIIFLPFSNQLFYTICSS